MAQLFVLFISSGLIVGFIFLIYLSIKKKGGTGLQLVQQALKRNHQVTAIVRNADKLKCFECDPNFRAVKADLMKPDEIAKHLSGQDCVLSALGSPGVHLFKISFYQDSIKSIINAMRKVNLKRLICVTAFYTKRERGIHLFLSFFLLMLIK